MHSETQAAGQTDAQPGDSPCCALAGGWVPVSSAEALAAEWEDKATNYMRTAPAAANPNHRERIEAVCDTLWHCARQLRRQVVESDERQPASPTGAAAAAAAGAQPVKRMTPPDTQTAAADMGVGTGALLGWFRVTEKLPPCGAIIACRAPHKTGRTMWWAGEIVEVWPQGFATMGVLQEHPRRFILTHDAEWCLLPNAEMSHANPKNS